MRKRIGISGKMASGKTTCSNYLIEKYGFQKVSFAKPLKWIAEDWFFRASRSGLYDSLLEGELYHFLVDLYLGDHQKASLSMYFLQDELLPSFTDIDWNVEKSERWRQLLQAIGDGLREKVDQNVWVNYMVSQFDEDGLYICDDVRYRNEFKILDSNEFQMIRLDISAEMQQKRLLARYGEIAFERLNHPSETDLDHTLFPHHINANEDIVCVLDHLVKVIEE